MNKMNKKGFTLIELLVVIAIIGILSSIVLVSLGGAREKARNARRQSDMRQISTAMEMFYDDNDSAYLISAAMPTAIGTYLTSVPLDPGSGTPAYGWIDNTGDTQRYCTYATLETTPVTYFAACNKGAKELSTIVGIDLDCNW